mgnify:CR=1 FL=1
MPDSNRGSSKTPIGPFHTTVFASAIAAAMGAEVFLITTSPGKAADAERLGAKGVIISRDEADMKKHAGSFHFILDTVSARHDLNAYFDLLKRDGVMVQVGVPPMPLPLERSNSFCTVATPVPRSTVGRLSPMSPLPPTLSRVP